MIELKTYENLKDNFDKMISGEETGVITLPYSCANIVKWNQQTGSAVSLATGVDKKEIEKLIYFEAAYIIDPKESDLPEKTIVPVYDLEKWISEHPDKTPPVYQYGTDGLRSLISQYDYKAKFQELRKQEQECMKHKECIYDFADFKEDEMSPQDEETLEKINYRLSIIRASLDAVLKMKHHADTLFINKVRMFPLEIRKHVWDIQNYTPYGLQDLQNLYLRILNRKNRIEKLEEIGAPEIILRNERRMLQESVDSLIWNGRRGKPITHSVGTNSEDETKWKFGYPYPSLLDIVSENINFV